ncbi:DEAD/DEAH box helicase [Kiritimatiellaeota bacterium B1221]|nr:DEAD/DEAH box helicase [Kiritimatiellaeota bacterium B1221]
MSTFNDYPLLSSLQETLREKEFKIPTEIQSLTLSETLAGHSVVGLAETGSGKTLAYVLPVLHHLKTLENAGKPVKEQGSPRAIVMVPNRELGEQVSKVFKTFTHNTRLRIRSVLGGTTLKLAKRNVSGCFEVLVATPTRILQLTEQGLSLNDVRLVVFDEADQMLDDSFIHNANRLVRACPPQPQMILFSATISPVVEKLIQKLFSDVQVYKSKGSHRVVSTLHTQNVTIINGERFPVICKLLRDEKMRGALVFTNTKKQCDNLAAQLQEKGCNCATFRGGMDRQERRKNLKEFTEGSIDLLIATDLASRGLDFADVHCVINYHLPEEMENYLHRAGRTARAGKSGQVINFVTERDKKLIDRVKKL